jgi:ribose transport system permease protein
VADRIRSMVSYRNVGALYVWVAIIAFFWWLAPDTFPRVDTVRSVLNNQSVTGLIAVSLVVPLAAGVYDLSVGYAAGFAGVLVAWLLANTSMSPWLAIALTILALVVVGAVNAFIVVILKVNSLIATLGTGTIIFALTKWVSDEKIITTRVAELSSRVARGQVWGITVPVFIMLGVALVVFYALEQTTTGRRWYAIGFDPEVARLAGVRVQALQIVAFLVSAGISGLAGILITARVSSASPDSGPSYLLPAFAAAFLGATQFRRGRFNAWGAIVAVLLLGTGTVGLSLAGAPTWAPDVFQGVVLIAAMALTRAKTS